MAGMRQLHAEMRREEKRAEAADPVTAKQLARAEKLGKEGFAAGKQAPAQDAKIVAMCKKRPHHVWMALMDAWNKGWQKAHIIESDNELRKAGWFNDKESSGSRKPKKTAAKPKLKTANTAYKLTATQKKTLKATGSVTIKRGGKFITITR